MISFGGGRAVIGNTGLQFSKPPFVASTWQAYLGGLSPVVWYRNNQLSGTVTNYGSAPSSDGTPSGTTTYGVAGQLGASEAITFAPNSVLTIPHNAAWAGLTAFEYWMLLKPTDTAGNDRLMGAGTELVGTWIRQVSDKRMQASVRNTVGGTATSVASSLPLTAGTYYLAMMSYDDAGDRMVHLCVNGVECTYTSQAALTGTLLTPSLAVTLLNNAALTLQAHADMDEFVIFGAVRSSAERLAATALAGL